MSKFKKGFYFKIVALVVGILFMFNTTLFAFSITRSSLRVPINQKQTILRLLDTMVSSNKKVDYINQNIKTQELYKKVCSKIKPELLNLKISENKKEMGLYYCLEIIKELQYWMKKYPDPEILIPMIFCTGNTPWVGYMFLGDFLNRWWDQDIQEILKANDIDPTFRPNMKRVLAFPMDAVLFQERDAHHAFANILNNMFDTIGILEKNRRFFYGDLIMEKDGKGIRRISRREFKALRKDIRKNGLQLEWPNKKTGLAKITAPEGSIQYRCFKAIEQRALALDEELCSHGGAMITTQGIGPAIPELGDGHVGFNDGKTRHAHDGPAYIAPACFYVRVAHSPEDRDQIRGTFIKKDGNIIPTMGVITFSLKSLFYRQDRDNPDNSGSVIVIAEGTKGPSMKRGIEEKYNPEIPMTYLSTLNSRTSIITEPFCADSLTMNQYPWWFKPYKEWSRHDIKEFFSKLALLRKKPIKDLEFKEDFLKFSEKDPYHPDIEVIKKFNLLTLTKGKSWDDLKKEVIEDIKNSRCRPKDLVDKQGPFAERLGIANKEKVTKLYTGPHLDDISLAMMEEIKASCEAGDEVYVYVVTRGFHAVDDIYSLEVLRHWKNWDTKQVGDFTKLDEEEFCEEEKKLLKELIEECKAKKHIQDRHDYNPWQHMSDKEKELRARLLFLRFNKVAMKGKLSTKEQVVALVNFLEKASNTRPYGGSRDLNRMEEIQTILRINEEQAADMSLGVKYENIILPGDVSFYVSGGVRAGTLEDKDMVAYREVVKKIKPDIIVYNRERFTDHKSHSITEMMVSIVALELKRDGTLPNIKLIGYAGVWERIVSYLADIGLMLNKKEMKEFFREIFAKIFVSQNPPLQPLADASDIMLFSDMVEENFSKSYEETMLLLGEEEVDKDYPYQANYTIIDLDDRAVVEDILNKIKEISESRQALFKAGDKAFNGALPMPDLTLMKKEIDELKRNGISLSDCVGLDEVADQLWNSKRADYRIKAAKVLQWIGTKDAENVLANRLSEEIALKKERSVVLKSLQAIKECL